MVENEIVRNIVDIAIQIHPETGPGLLETVYEIILAQPEMASSVFSCCARSRSHGLCVLTTVVL